MAILTQEQLNQIAAQNAAAMAASPHARAIYQQQTGTPYTPYQAPAVSTLPTTQTVSNRTLGITTSSQSSLPTGQTISQSGIEIYSPYTGEVRKNWTGEVPFGWHSRPMEQPAQTQTSTQSEIPQNVFETLMETLAQKGVTINPNVELTPDKLAEFLKKAESEIAPFYANRLASARDSILRQAGYTTEEVQLQERRLEQKYGKAVRQLGESAADRGFAQSGIRQTEERELATDTQNQIDDNRRKLAFDTGSDAAQFATQFGASNLPSLPGLPNAPRVLAGQGAFQQQSGTRSLYQLSPGVYDALKGSDQFQERADTLNRASDLESAYRTRQGIAQQRSLII